MGSAVNPDGKVLTLDRHSLLLDGERWTPVMGEFHYSRYPANRWREELWKMKAGGIDILATYVFWIHHEEIEGEFNWSGQRDLRRFVDLAGEVGLAVVVRCGPWCHGEVRNGGLPDWTLDRGWQVRSTDEGFLAHVRTLYGEIEKQLHGLLWKNGGPVIGIQVDNEFGGPAEYLLALKQIARAAGLDVPLYTRTGWPELSTPIPFGEILPLYGAYAEGFWDREITPMPGTYWQRFRFSALRTDANIASEQLGRRIAEDEADTAQYPYFTCEIGGGMPASYHRRIFAYPEDQESLALVQVGSGSVLPGYYMYHGGTNPEGRLTTLMEAQNTPLTNWNDLPVSSYDFQAPLGEFGQIRRHYHLLRRLHLFLRDFGSQLAAMMPSFPPQPQNSDDVATLRWAVRSNGRSGFVFVNNYQRLQPLPAKPNAQFSLRLSDGDSTVTFPTRPVTLPANDCFFWPFNLELGHNLVLRHASAQPVCWVDNGDVRTMFFAATPGVPAEFAFLIGRDRIRVERGEVSGADELTVVSNVPSGTDPAIQIRADGGAIVRIILLDDESSLKLYKSSWAGREAVFFSRAGLVFDGDQIRITAENSADLTVGIFPAPTAPIANASGARDGVFQMIADAPAPIAPLAPEWELVREAGPAREVPLATTPQPVAAAPDDADFAAAAVWRIKLPAGLEAAGDPLLRVHYVGDVARVSLNGRLLTDNFYNGRVFDVGLDHYAPEIFGGELELAILPLRKDAPIYLATHARPDFGGSESVVRLDQVEIVQRPSITINAP